MTDYPRKTDRVRSSPSPASQPMPDARVPPGMATSQRFTSGWAPTTPCSVPCGHLRGPRPDPMDPPCPECLPGNRKKPHEEMGG